MPGIQMSLDALQNTGLLPGIPADTPVSLLGKNTKDCMHTGVIRGAVYSALGFANEYKENFLGNKNAKLVVSGGFAEYTLPYISENKVYIPNLTLEGLNIIYSLNKNKVIPRTK
jgi:type III pantothenate kinase